MVRQEARPGSHLLPRARVGGQELGGKIGGLWDVRGISEIFLAGISYVGGDLVHWPPAGKKTFPYWNGGESPLMGTVSMLATSGLISLFLLGPV